MNITDRIKKLRELMRARHIDAYLIPSDDSHQSEYVSDHFKAREFITGFTGSAGTAVVTPSSACLFTDGRYFLQAEKELEGSEITLFRMGEPDVPSLSQYLTDTIPRGGTLGFDGRVVSMELGETLARTLTEGKGIRLDSSVDLIGSIWADRPPLPAKPAFILEERYAGESVPSKLSRIRDFMKKQKADIHVLASLDDINWLVNLRGSDIDYSPLVLCYAVLTLDRAILYIDKNKLNLEIQKKLARERIEIKPYGSIYEDVQKIPGNRSVLIDPKRLNYALYQCLPESVRIIPEQNPSVLLKAVKNDVQLANIRNAHIKDGIAVTRFMYWLKTRAGKQTITERSAARKLESFRRGQKGYLSDSFAPILAYGEHGAIVHYSASEDTDCPLAPGSFLLADTGGGYLEGSTDITRTFAIGSVTQKMKDHFTTVLLGNLHLSQAVFPEGTKGFQLDMLARQPLLKKNLNYNHGTGHGVGYLTNVHEAPASFSYNDKEAAHQPLKAGMVITNEPGLYLAGRYGIRIENEMIVRKGEKNEYGQFLYFEPITYAPIDLDAVNPALMSPEDRELLNDYHRKVRELISPHLSREEKEWLLHYTRAV